MLQTSSILLLSMLNMFFTAPLCHTPRLLTTSPLSPFYLLLSMSSISLSLPLAHSPFCCPDGWPGAMTGFTKLTSAAHDLMQQPPLSHWQPSRFGGGRKLLNCLDPLLLILPFSSALPPTFPLSLLFPPYPSSYSFPSLVFSPPFLFYPPLLCPSSPPSSNIYVAGSFFILSHPILSVFYPPPLLLCPSHRIPWYKIPTSAHQVLSCGKDLTALAPLLPPSSLPPPSTCLPPELPRLTLPPSTSLTIAPFSIFAPTFWYFQSKSSKNF